MVERVEERTNVEIQDPVTPPTPFPCSHQGIVGRAARSIAIRVRVELWLDNWFEDHLHHVLSDAVCDRRHSESSFTPVALGDRHQLDWRREVRPRRHSVPDPVEVVLEVELKGLNGLAIHSGSATTGFHPLEGFPYQLLGDVEWLCYSHRLLPVSVGLSSQLNDATPLLQSVSRPSSLLRVAPPLCSASGLAPLQGLPAWALPFASKRQVPTFRTEA